MSDDQRRRVIKLLDSIPDEELEDLEDHLRDIIDFWETRNNYNPPPKPKSIQFRMTPIKDDES